MKKRMAWKIQKRIVFGFLISVLFVVRGFPLEWGVHLSFGNYTKADPYFEQFYGKSSSIPGVGLSLYLAKNTGLFIDINMFSTDSQSSYDNKPMEYKERHISAGLLYRFPLYCFSPDKNLAAYFKAGALILRYGETFEETIIKNIPGYCFGLGVMFRFKKIGIALETVKNFAFEEIKIQGLNIIENIDFSGIRLSLIGSYTF